MKTTSLLIVLCLLEGLPTWSWTLKSCGIASRPTLSFRTRSTRLFSDPWNAPPGWGPESEEELSMENDDGRLSDEELEATLEPWDEKIARFNTVHLVGRLGSDPEPKYFDDGKVVVNVSMASKRKYHTLQRKALGIKQGEEETDWYGLEIWGQTAEFVSKYVDKGARVGVIGSLQVDSWVDKATGERRERAKVIVRDFDVLETKAEAELRRGQKRGPSFYTSDSDDDDGDYKPTSGAAGGFFD